MIFRNRIYTTAQGLEDIAKLCFKYNSANELCFDFDCLLPLPKDISLNLTEETDKELLLYLSSKDPNIQVIGTKEDKLRKDAYERLLAKVKRSGFAHQELIVNETKAKKLIRNMKQEEIPIFLENGKKQIESLKKYGYTSLFEWMLFNRGCIGNGFNVIKKDNFIQFDTLVCVPIQMMVSLSKKFPYLDIGHIFTNESEGYDVGAFIYENGLGKFKAFYDDQTREALSISKTLLSLNPKKQIKQIETKADKSLGGAQACY